MEREGSGSMSPRNSKRGGKGVAIEIAKKTSERVLKLSPSSSRAKGRRNVFSGPRSRFLHPSEPGQYAGGGNFGVGISENNSMKTEIVLEDDLVSLTESESSSSSSSQSGDGGEETKEGDGEGGGGDGEDGEKKKKKKKKKKGDDDDDDEPEEKVATQDEMAEKDAEFFVAQLKNLMGLGPLDESAQWLKMTYKDQKRHRVLNRGAIAISVEILPIEDAENRPAGHGIAEPNQNPTLPPRTGRMALSTDPFAILAELFGPQCIMIFCCCLCCLLVALLWFYLGMYYVNIYNMLEAFGIVGCSTI